MVTLTSRRAWRESNDQPTLRAGKRGTAGVKFQRRRRCSSLRVRTPFFRMAFSTATLRSNRIASFLSHSASRYRSKSCCRLYNFCNALFRDSARCARSRSLSTKMRLTRRKSFFSLAGSAAQGSATPGTPPALKDGELSTRRYDDLSMVCSAASLAKADREYRTIVTIPLRRRDGPILETPW